MTQADFVQWLRGFTAAIKGAPSQEQWEALQAKLQQVAGESLTIPVREFYPQVGPYVAQPYVPPPTWIGPDTSPLKYTVTCAADFPPGTVTAYIAN